jgi:hypothetical protein
MPGVDGADEGEAHKKGTADEEVSGAQRVRFKKAGRAARVR